MEACPCGSTQDFTECCADFLNGKRFPETAEQLMRSRYSAFSSTNVTYIIESTHPDKRSQTQESSVRKWAENSQWHGLEIVATEAGGQTEETGWVEFIAHYTEKGVRQRHHEIAEFKKVEDRWYFYDGQPPQVTQFVREAPKVGRNEPCPCNSGKKYKKCCGR